MKSRKMIIAVLLFAAVAVSGATFAFWASGVNGNNDSATGTVTIGEGETVETTVTVADVAAGGTLVPVGYEESGVTVNNEDKEFTVEWEGTGATGATGTLNVSVTSLSLGTLTQAEIESMFTIDVTATPSITAGTPLTHTINIEFTNEPADQAMYDQVASGSLVVTFDFTVNAD